VHYKAPFVHTPRSIISLASFRRFRREAGRNERLPVCPDDSETCARPAVGTQDRPESEEKMTTEAEEVSSKVTSPSTGRPAGSVRVEIGTSKLATQAFCCQVAEMANRAYGYPRLSPPEVSQRLSMGDDGKHANRVLHLAFRLQTTDGEEILVGCCSSTKQTPWCPRGCGHWGLLVVAVEAQGTGVGSALVRAAEQRLRLAGLQSVQIEYEYTRGDPDSERLYAWYEGSLGFSGGGPPGYNEFRRCRKKLKAPTDEDEKAHSGSCAGRRHGASPSPSAATATPGGAEASHSTVAKQNVRCWGLLLRIYRRLLS